MPRFAAPAVRPAWQRRAPDLTWSPVGVQLFTRVGALGCAIPIEHVIETMRPLPIEPLGDATEPVRGVAIVRGAPVPVVDLAALLGQPGRPSRLVIVRAGERRVGLLVDAVEAVRELDGAQLAALPPLLRDARHDRVARIGALDAELMVVLDVARLVPEAT